MVNDEFGERKLNRSSIENSSSLKSGAGDKIIEAQDLADRVAAMLTKIILSAEN